MPELGYQANINPELVAKAPEVVPLARLTGHPMNPRQHRIEKIAQALTTYGQRKPVIVDRYGTIVAGHGVVEAARLLGWDSIAVIVEDFASTEQELGFLFADNRASDLSGYKRDMLLAGLEKLAEGPGITDTLFEVQELEDLREEFQPIRALPDAGTGDEDEEAEPTARPAPTQGDRLHEMPILLTQADYANVIAWVKALQTEWNLSGVTATVVYAIKYAAEHVAEHKGVEDGTPATPTYVSPLREAAVETGGTTGSDFPF